MTTDFDVIAKRAEIRAKKARQRLGLNKEQTNNQPSNYIQPTLESKNPIQPTLKDGFKVKFDWDEGIKRLHEEANATYTAEPTLLDDTWTAVKKGVGTLGQSTVGLYTQATRATSAEEIRNATDWTGGLVKPTEISREQRQKETQDFIAAQAKHKQHIEELNNALGFDAYVNKQQDAYSDKTKQALTAYNHAGNTGSFIKDVQETLDVFYHNPRLVPVLLGESAPQTAVELAAAALTGGTSRTLSAASAIGTGTLLKTGDVVHENFENTGKVIDNDKIGGVAGLNALASIIDIGSAKIPNTLDNALYNAVLRKNIVDKRVKHAVTNSKVKNLGKDAFFEGVAEAIENTASNYGQGKELTGGAGKAFASGAVLSTGANIGTESAGTTIDASKSLGSELSNATLTAASKIQEKIKTNQDDPKHPKYNPNRSLFEAQKQILSDDDAEQAQGVASYVQTMQKASERLAHLDDLINNAKTEKQKYKANKQKEEYLNNILPELLQRDQLLTELIKDKYKQNDDLRNNITNSLQWLATQKQELTEQLKQLHTASSEQSTGSLQSNHGNTVAIMGRASVGDVGVGTDHYDIRLANSQDPTSILNRFLAGGKPLNEFKHSNGGAYNQQRGNKQHKGIDFGFNESFGGQDKYRTLTISPEFMNKLEYIKTGHDKKGGGHYTRIKFSDMPTEIRILHQNETGVKQVISGWQNNANTNANTKQNNTTSNSKVDNNSLFVGDSIARGYKQSNLATNGHNPKKVLNTLQKASSNGGLTGKTVVLSTGLSNNVTDWANVDKQLKLLSESGANVVVLGIADNFKDNTTLANQVNTKLKQKAEAYGFGYQALGNYRSGEAEKQYKAHPNNIKLSDMVLAGNKDNHQNTSTQSNLGSINYSWGKSKVHRKLSNSNQYDDLMTEIYSTYGFTKQEQQILKMQVAQESGFNINAKNPTSGAFGLTQFIPSTAKAYGAKEGNAKSQINAQARYMKGLLKQFNGDWAKALAAYNTGPDNIKKHWGKDGTGKGGGVMTYSWSKGTGETLKYVENIMAHVGDVSYDTNSTQTSYQNFGENLDDAIEWGESHVSKLLKQKEQEQDAIKSQELQEQVDNLTQTLNELNEIEAKRKELEAHQAQDEPKRSVADILTKTELAEEEIQTNEKLNDEEKTTLLSIKNTKDTLLNALPERLRESFLKQEVDQDINDFFGKYRQQQEQVQEQNQDNLQDDEIKASNIQLSDALKSVFKPRQTQDDEVEERIKVKDSSQSNLDGDLFETDKPSNNTTGFKDIQHSSINIRDVDYLQQQGIFTPEQANSLRKLNDFNTKLANSSNLSDVHEQVLYGIQGFNKQITHKGIKQYNDELTQAITSSHNKLLTKSFTQLNNWVSNHTSKASLINQHIDESSKDNPIYLVADNNNIWRVAENKEVYDKANKGNRLALQGNISKRLQDTVNKEASLLTEFYHNWEGTIQQFYGEQFKAFNSQLKPITPIQIKTDGNSNTGDDDSNSTDGGDTNDNSNNINTNNPNITISNTQSHTKQTSEGELTHFSSTKKFSDGQIRPIKGKLYDDFHSMANEVGLDLTHPQTQKLQNEANETGNLVTLTSVLKDKANQLWAMVGVNGKKYQLPIDNQKTGINTDNQTDDGSDETKTDDQNQDNNKQSNNTVANNDGITFIPSKERNTVDAKDTVYVGRGTSMLGGLFSLSSVTKTKYIGHDGWLGNPFNVNPSKPNKFSVASLEEGAKRYLETLQDKAQTIEGFLDALIGLKGKKVYADQAGQTKQIGDKNIIKAIVDNIPEDKAEAQDFIQKLTVNEDGQIQLPKPSVKFSDDIKTDSEQNPDTIFLTTDALSTKDRQYADAENVISFNLAGKNKHGHDYVSDSINTNYHQGRINATLDQIRQAYDAGKQIVVDEQGIATHLKTSAPKLYKQIKDGILDILDHDIDAQTQNQSTANRSTVDSSKNSKGHGKLLPQIDSAGKEKQTIDLSQKQSLGTEEVTQIEYDGETGEQRSNTFKREIYKDPESEELTLKDITGLKEPLVLDDHYDGIIKALDDGDASKEAKAVKHLTESLLNHIPDIKVSVSDTDHQDNLFDAKDKHIRLSTKAKQSLHEQLVTGMIKASNQYLSAELKAEKTRPAKELKKDLQDIVEQLDKTNFNDYTTDNETLELIPHMLKSLDSLLEYGLGNKKMIHLLNKIPDKNSNKPSKSSLFGSMVKSVGNFFGFSNKTNQTLYSRLLKAQSDAVKIQNDTTIDFTPNDAGETTVHGLDNSTKDTNPYDYYQKNWFADGFKQDSTKQKPLSSVTNFSSKLKADLNKGLDSLGIKEPSHKQRKQVNHFLSFRDKFGEHLTKTFQTKHENTQFRDLKGYMVNDAGEVSENTLTALALVAYNYINSDGGHITNLERDLKKLLNVDDDDSLHITKEIWETYAHIGQLHNNVALTLGRNVVNTLGLKANDTISTQMQSRLEASLGDWVLASLQSANVVGFHHISSQKHHDNILTVGGKADFTPNEYGRVNFVSFTNKAGELYNDSLISNIKEHSQGTLNYLSSIFGGEDRQRYPLLGKPEKVITKIRGVTYNMSKAQQALVKRMQEEPMHIDKSMAGVVTALNDVDQDFLHDLIGAKITQEDLDTAHDTDIKSIESRAEGLARELQNALSFMTGLKKDENGEYPQFWDYIYAAKNTRMHYNSNMFDMQSSKVARALGHLNSHIVIHEANELSMDISNLIDESENATALGNFFKAIAESAEGTKDYVKDYLQNNPKTKDKYYEGFTVDKIEDKDFIEAFTHYLNTDADVQNAVTATKQLLDNPKKLSNTQKQAILKVVKHWEVEASSLRALIEYTKYVQAVETNTQFTTGLAIGSDGINNGSAILTILMGLMNNPIVLARFGLIHEEFAQKYNVNDYLQTRSLKDVGDFYTGFRSFLNDAVASVYADNADKLSDYQIMTKVSPSFTFESRSLLKALLIPFGYSAGVKRLQMIAVEAGLADVKAIMMSAYNDFRALNQQLQSGDINPQDYHDQLKTIENRITVYNEDLMMFADVSLPTFDNGVVDIAKLKSFWFTGKQMQNLQKSYHDLFSPVLSQALDNYQGDLIKARRLTTGMHGMASSVFITLQQKLEQQVANEIKEDIRQHIKSDLSYIKKSLNKKYQKQKETTVKANKKWQGWSDETKTKELNDAIEAQVENTFSIIGIPKAVYQQKVLDPLDKIKPVIDSSISFTGDFDKPAEGSEISLYQITTTISSASNNINTETLASGSAGEYVKVSRSLAERNQSFTDIGVLGQSIQVQGVDATTAAKANGSGAMVSLNVHDAKITNTKHAQDSAKYQNQVFHQTVLNYSMNTVNANIDVQMLSALDDFIKQGKFEDKYDAMISVITTLNPVSVEKQDSKVNTADKIGEIAKQLMIDVVRKAGNTDYRKLNQIQKLAYNHQYGFQGGSYKVTEQDNKQAKKNQEVVTKQIKSLIKQVEKLSLDIHQDSIIKPTGYPPTNSKQTKYISSEPNKKWTDSRRQFTGYYTTDDKVMIGKIRDMDADDSAMQLGNILAHRELDKALKVGVAEITFENPKYVPKSVIAKLVNHGYLVENNQNNATNTWLNQTNETLKITRPNNQTNKSADHRIYSGLAKGADILWGQIAQKHGFSNQTHFRAYDSTIKPSLLNTTSKSWQYALTQQMTNQGRLTVSSLLGRQFKDDVVGNLQARNLYQVINADRVIAITEINHTNTNETRYPIVGGTNTAVMIAKVLGKEVYVWDINTTAWHVLDSQGILQPTTDIPSLTVNTALIGTRKLDNKNKNYVGDAVKAKALDAMQGVMKVTHSKGAKQTSTHTHVSDGQVGKDDGTAVSLSEFKDRVITHLNEAINTSKLTPYLEKQATYAQAMMSLWGGILKQGNAGIQVKIQNDVDMVSNPDAINGQATAYYVASEKTIYMSHTVAYPSTTQEIINTATILAHEMVHAGTADRMFKTAEQITKGMDSKQATRISQAYDALENLRQQAQAKADTNNRQIQTSNLSEFMAYFYSDMSFMNWVLSLDLPIVANKRKKATWYKSLKTKLDKITAWFKDALGLSKQEAQQFETINAHAMTLIESMSYESDLFTRQYSSVGINDDVQINETVNNFSSKETFHRLDKGAISDSHNEHLNTLFDKLISHHKQVSSEYQNKVDKTKGNLISDALTHGFRMSDKELHAYEAMYLLSEAFQEPTKGSVPLRQIQTIYEDVRASMTADDFLTNKAQATKEDKAIAKKQWEYLFADNKEDIPKQIHRFISLALSNEQFKQQINEVIVPTKTYDKDIWFTEIIKYIDKALNWLNEAYLKVQGKDRADKISTLVYRLADIETKARNNHVNRLIGLYHLILKPLAPINKVTAQGFDAVKHTARNVVSTATGNKQALKNLQAEETLRVLQTKGIKDPLQFFESVFPEAQSKQRYGVFMETLNEVRGYNEVNSSIEKMLRVTQTLGKLRENDYTASKARLNDMLGHVETKDRHTITNLLLRTDVSSLLDHYSMDQVLKLVSDKQAIQEEITQAESMIEKTTQQKTSAGLIMHTKTLGAHLLREHSPEHLLKNSQSIISYYFDESTNAPEGMQDTVDKLATLYALSYMTAQEQANITQVVDNNKEGIKSLLTYHKDIIKRSKEDFKDNPYSYQKGYLPEKVNPLRSLQWVEADSAEYNKLLNEGWKDIFQEDLSQDKSDLSNKKRILYHQDAHYQNYSSGALDMKDTHIKGSVAYDIYNTRQDITRVVKTKVAEVDKRNATVDPHKFNPFKSSGALIPAFNADGSLINFHYEMSANSKNNFLERDNDFIELLARMDSELDYKPKLTQQQRAVARALYQDYKEAYKKNPETFVILSRDSTNPEVQRLWRTLPYHFRAEASSLYGKNQPIIVRRQLVNMAFGFSNFSLSGIWDKDIRDLNPLERTIKIMFDILLSNLGTQLPKVKYRVLQLERLNELLVKLAKDFVVIRTVDVLWGNIISNTLVLLMHGISPVDIAKGYTQSWIQGREYRKLEQKLADKKIQLRMTKDNQTKIKGEIARLEHALKNHRMHTHMQAGFMSSIVDDTKIIGADTYYGSKLEETLANGWDKIPKPLRSGLEILMMSPNTKAYKFMSDATQFSDFAAKTILVEHKQKQGLSYDNSATYAQNTFINYDAPQHRMLEYQSRMGMALFLKFFLRFQRVLYNLFQEKPASILLQHYAVEALGQAGIADPSILHRFGNNPFSMGGLNIVDSFQNITTVDLATDAVSDIF